MLINWFGNQKRERRAKKRADLLSEQVKKVLGAADQKLILMVRV